MPAPNYQLGKALTLMSTALLSATLCINAAAQTSNPDKQSLDRSNWAASATSKPTEASRAFDNSVTSRWSTAQTQRAGQEFILDLGTRETFNRIKLDAGSSKMDYPRGYSVHVSDDRQRWGAALVKGKGNNAITNIDLPEQTARYIKITQDGSDSRHWWSIHELSLFNEKVSVDGDAVALDRSKWQLSSNNNQANLGKLIDGKIGSRWTTKSKQQDGQFVQIDLSKSEKLSEIVMTTTGGGVSGLDYPRKLEVQVSIDGQTWNTASQSAGDKDGTTNIDLKQTDARYLRLTQTGANDFYWWSIHELNVYAQNSQPGGNIAPSASFVKPSSGSKYTEGDDLSVEVLAQDDDGTVASVDLYLNDGFVRQSKTAPHNWGAAQADAQLQNMAVGTYDIKAVATDDQGAKTSISTVVQFLLDDVPPGNDQPVTEHRYPKTEGPNINPLKGWNSGWGDDRSESSVGFQYIPWKDLEPRNGQFNFDNIEKLLDQGGSKGRHFVLRLFCDWYGESKTPRGCPDWMYSEVGVRRIRGDNGKYITDYNDPKYIREATQAIAALGKKYDNDPRVHSFQIGVLGYWGEWHTFNSSINGKRYEISQQSETSILNAYRNAFKRVKIVARYPYRSILQNTTDIGFHNDFFKPNNNHSAEFDNAVAEGERWKDGPIGGEIPPGLSSQDFDALYLTSQGKEMVEKGRYSTMKPASVSAKHLDGHMKLHRRMGYNFQINKALFSEKNKRSDRLNVSLDITNVGVAPLYYPWLAQFALLDRNNNVVKVINADRHDLTKHLPNASFTLKSKIDLNNIGAGGYKLATRIIQPNADQKRSTRWKLKARNTYILFANDMPVVEGEWNSDNKLVGGWSLLGDVSVN